MTRKGFFKGLLGAGAGLTVVAQEVTKPEVIKVKVPERDPILDKIAKDVEELKRNQIRVKPFSSYYSCSYSIPYQTDREM